MLNHYFAIFIRCLRRDRLYSVINIFGLSLGICASLLISLYVFYESSYDQYHTEKENLYRVRVEGKTKEGVMQFQSARNFSAVGPAVKERYPEVVEQARAIDLESVVSSDSFT